MGQWPSRNAIELGLNWGSRIPWAVRKLSVRASLQNWRNGVESWARIDSGAWRICCNRHVGVCRSVATLEQGRRNRWLAWLLVNQLCSLS